MGWAEELAKKAAGAAGVQVPGMPSGAPKLPGLPDLGGMWKKGTDAAAGFAAEKANAGARFAAISQLPDKLDLSKSKELETYIEKGLTALGAQGIKIDGKPDPQTLAALNTVLVSQGRPELASLNDFGKDDLKAFNTVLGDSVGADGKPNLQAKNTLETATQLFVNIQKDYPKPKEPAAAPATAPDVSPGG